MYRFLFLILFSAITFAACQIEEKVIPPPEIFMQIPDGGFDFDTDSVELIEPKITYDIKSEYIWKEKDVTFHTEKIYEFKNRPLGTYLLNFTVTTPYGEDAMDITVNSLDINSYEEFKQLNDKGYYNNPESGYHQFKYVQYPCYYNSNAPEEWGGFALSDNTKKTDATVANEFSVYASSGADESEIFAVYKQLANQAFPVRFSDGNAHIVKSIEVNNSTRSYLTMQSGFNKKEGKDFYLLSITGLDAAGTKISGPVEFLLADYRPELTSDKYLVSEWKKIDLTELGAIHQLAFVLSSSRDDDPEFNMPMYFCLDNLKIID